MWGEVRAAIFDDRAATGLRLGFLENISAEIVGVVLGVLLSFLAAYLLDKIGNSRQFRPLRFRLASQLAAIHEQLRLELAKPFSRTQNNGEPVRQALKEIDQIVEQFDFGLTPKQHSAVDAYRMRLKALEMHASSALRRGEAVRAGYRTASEALRPALKRLHSGRLEAHWSDVLSADIFDQEPRTRRKPLAAWFTSKGARPVSAMTSSPESD
jgi:hypothetical protein